MLRLWTPITAVMLALATLLSLALLVLALTFPVYGEESSEAVVEGAAPGPVTRTSATLVEVNGYGALVVVAVPLVVTLLVALLVRRGSRVVELVAAWALVLLYGGLCVLALLSIGIFLTPVAMALVAACATARLGAVSVPQAQPTTG